MRRGRRGEGNEEKGGEEEEGISDDGRRKGKRGGMGENKARGRGRGRAGEATEPLHWRVAKRVQHCATF